MTEENQTNSNATALHTTVSKYRQSVNIAQSELLPDEILQQIYAEQRQLRVDEIKERYSDKGIEYRLPLTSVILSNPVLRHCGRFVNLANRLFPPHTQRRKKLIAIVRKVIK